MAYFKSKLQYFLYGVGSLISIFPNVFSTTPQNVLVISRSSEVA